MVEGLRVFLGAREKIREPRFARYILASHHASYPRKILARLAQQLILFLQADTKYLREQIASIVDHFVEKGFESSFARIVKI